MSMIFSNEAVLPVKARPAVLLVKVTLQLVLLKSELTEVILYSVQLRLIRFVMSTQREQNPSVATGGQVQFPVPQKNWGELTFRLDPDVSETIMFNSSSGSGKWLETSLARPWPSY